MIKKAIFHKNELKKQMEILMKKNSINQFEEIRKEPIRRKLIEDMRIFLINNCIKIEKEGCQEAHPRYRKTKYYFKDNNITINDNLIFW